MKLICEIEVGIDVYLKTSGAKVSTTRKLKREFDEFSEEFDSMRVAYEMEFGYTRKSDTKRFDEEFMRCINADSTIVMKESVDDVISTFKSKCMTGSGGYVELIGAVFDLSDVSAIIVNDYKTKITKR